MVSGFNERTQKLFWHGRCGLTVRIFENNGAVLRWLGWRPSRWRTHNLGPGVESALTKPELTNRERLEY